LTFCCIPQLSFSFYRHRSIQADFSGGQIVTHLESTSVPSALVKYWTGHANATDGEIVKSTVTDKYVKMAKDTKFRTAVAERIGLGFDLPKVEPAEVVPSVPSSQETEVAVSV
jgi:hypothetical protein